jgi:hypothetical protein
MKRNKKDILKNLKSRDAGFLIPENYFAEFEKDLQENDKKIKSGFTSPKNYFDQVEGSIPILLDPEGNNSGFRVPDNYFKNIDQRIFDNIKVSKPGKIINFNTNKYLKILSYSIAASLLLFFSLRSLNSRNTMFDFETIEISEIESWMDDDLITFSSYDISETFEDVYLTGVGDYSEEEILDYLDGENIENLIIDN